MRTTLALTEALHAQLAASLSEERESAGVLSGRIIADHHGVTLLGRTLRWATPKDYIVRDPDRLSLRSTAWVPAFRAAAKAGEVAMFVHTHPHGAAEFSGYDDIVDAELQSTLRPLGIEGPYVAVLVSGSPGNAQITCRLYLDGPDPIYCDLIRIVGDRVQLQLPSGTSKAALATETFDRQIRMFGQDGQRHLGALHVSIVGTGGTGSAVAEQLTRLGVGELTLIDDDVITKPTPTRGYGMRNEQLGQPKATTLAAHLASIGLSTTVNVVEQSLHHPDALAAIAHADVVFSCVDGHGARLILNRFAYAHLAPVVDTAVLVSAHPSLSIDGRVTWLAPGTACLLCRGRIDPALAYAENLDPLQRQELAGEGYAVAAETAQPAVITLTSLVAATATTELLIRLFGLGEIDSSELLLRPLQHEVRRNRREPRTGCFCTDIGFSGRGTRAPYLDLMWAT